MYAFFLVYVEQGRSTTATTLTFTIATGGTWKVKVTQIECWKQVFLDRNQSGYFLILSRKHTEFYKF